PPFFMSAICFFKLAISSCKSFTLSESVEVVLVLVGFLANSFSKSLICFFNDLISSFNNATFSLLSSVFVSVLLLLSVVALSLLVVLLSLFEVLLSLVVLFTSPKITSCRSIPLLISLYADTGGM